MAGQSEQEKAATQTYGQIKNMPTNAPYGVDEMMKALNDYYNSSASDIRKNTATDINTAGSNVGSRLAGAGITGGALKEGAIDRTTNNIRKEGASSLDKLTQGRLAQVPNIQQMGNNNALDWLKSKYGLQLSAMGGLDNTTWLDDVFAGANAVGNLAPWNWGGGASGGK